ncbi:location of vulva defective 1-like [Argonauta hians]
MVKSKFKGGNITSDNSTESCSVSCHINNKCLAYYWSQSCTLFRSLTQLEVNKMGDTIIVCPDGSQLIVVDNMIKTVNSVNIELKLCEKHAQRPQDIIMPTTTATTSTVSTTPTTTPATTPATSTVSTTTPATSTVSTTTPATSTVSTTTPATSTVSTTTPATSTVSTTPTTTPATTPATSTVSTTTPATSTVSTTTPATSTVSTTTPTTPTVSTTTPATSTVSTTPTTTPATTPATSTVSTTTPATSTVSTTTPATSTVSTTTSTVSTTTPATPTVSDFLRNKSALNVSYFKSLAGKAEDSLLSFSPESAEDLATSVMNVTEAFLEEDQTEVQYMNILEGLSTFNTALSKTSETLTLAPSMLKTSTRLMKVKKPGSEFNISLGDMEIVGKKPEEDDFNSFDLKTNSGTLNVPKVMREKYPSSIIMFFGFKEKVHFPDLKNATISSSVVISLNDDNGKPRFVDDSDVNFGLSLNCKEIEKEKAVLLKPDKTSGKYPMKIPLNNKGLSLIELKSVNSIKVWGKINESPTKYDYHFYYSSYGSENVTDILREGVNVNRKGGSEPRRLQKRSSDQEQLGVKLASFIPQVFDNNRKKRKSNQNIETISMDDKYNLVLKSNIFGTFTSVINMITPATLDFDEIFFNLDKKVLENPYVLIVLLVIFVIYCILTIVVRHYDKKDKINWEYVPLVDNVNTDKYLYLAKVHTGLQSSRFFTATPYFRLKGKDSKTNIRILRDGARQNFKSGTMSGFIIQTSCHLGHLQSLKIWHDCEGNSPNWFLSNIEIKDLTTNQWYNFECNNWLAFNKGDGLIIRKLTPARGQLVDLFEATKIRIYRSLFDEHLYFSIVKRPRSSNFTRIQRLSSLTAILYLSLVSSAMFFKPNEKIPSKVVYIGIFPISSKEIYVGIISSLVMIIPTSLIIFLFKNRKVKNTKGDQIIKKVSLKKKEGKKGKKKKEEIEKEEKVSIIKRLKGFRFPWWTVYIAYLLVFSAIGASSFITFSYSMQWGKELSLRWILSIFFNVSGSILFVQPLKIVATAMILSCIFKSPNTEEDKHDTILDNNQLYDLSKFSALPKEPLKICPMPNLTTPDWQKKKEILQLDSKLFNVFQSLFFQVFYLVLVLLLIANESVNQCFLQNKSIEKMFYLNSLSRTGGIDSMWDWIEAYAIPGIFPSSETNGKELKIYDQYFLLDKANRRLGGVRLRQKRMLKVPCQMSRLVNICIPNYSEEYEDTKDYSPGWKVGTTQKMKDEYVVSAFKYTPREKTGYSSSEYGIQGEFNSAGYLIDLNERHNRAKSVFKKLRSNTWIDERTRVVFIDVSTYNANSGLFTSTEIMFERLSCGRIEAIVQSESFKFHPFVNPLDYLVLLVIIIISIVCLVNLVGVAIAIKKRRLRALTELQVLINIVNVVALIIVQIGFVLRIDALLEMQAKLVENPDGYVSGSIMSSRVTVYIAGLSFCVVVSAIKLLQPLNFNYHLFLMKTSILISLPSIASFSMVLIILMTAFAISIYLTFHNISVHFIDLKSTYFALFRIFLAMGKFKETFGMVTIMSNLVFFFYTITVSIILLNICISIINDAFAFVKSSITSPGFEYSYDYKLNEHFWYRITALFRKKKELYKDQTQSIEMNSKVTKKVFQKFDHLVCDSIGNFEEISWILFKKYINCYLDMNLRKCDPGVFQTKLDVVGDAMNIFQPVFTDLRQMAKQLEVQKINNGAKNWTLWYYWKQTQPLVKICCSTYREDEVPQILCYNVTDDKSHMLQQVQCSSLLGPLIWVYQPAPCNIDQSNIDITAFCVEELHRYQCCELIYTNDGINWSNCCHSPSIPSHDIGVSRVEPKSTESQKSVSGLPCYIALIKQLRTEVRSCVDPSKGWNMVSQLEPNLTIIFSPRITSQNITVRLKLNPYQPLPQLSLTFHPDLHQPITIHFSTTKHSPDPDLQLYTRTNFTEWTEEAIFIGQNQGISFKIKPTSNVETIYMLKPSYISWDWQKQIQFMKDPLNKDFLLRVSDSIGTGWKFLAAELNVPGFVVQRISKSSAHTAPAAACYKMLHTWQNSLQVTTNKLQPLVLALSTLGYQKLVEELFTRLEECRNKCETAFSGEFYFKSSLRELEWHDGIFRITCPTHTRFISRH